MQEFERAVLRNYPARQIQDDAAFCAAAGEIQGEFLVIHPFREGNARTIKLATNLLTKLPEKRVPGSANLFPVRLLLLTSGVPEPESPNK